MWDIFDIVRNCPIFCELEGNGLILCELEVTYIFSILKINKAKKLKLAMVCNKMQFV